MAGPHKVRPGRAQDAGLRQLHARLGQLQPEHEARFRCRHEHTHKLIQGGANQVLLAGEARDFELLEFGGAVVRGYGYQPGYGSDFLSTLQWDDCKMISASAGNGGTIEVE